MFLSSLVKRTFAAHYHGLASQAALNEFSAASPPPADRTTAEELSGRQEEVKRSLMAVQNQTSLNRTVVDQQQAELRDNVETSQQLVHGFLQEELQQDVPTGATPQRRDFVYPKRLEKLRSRGELLESLRRQQEELQAAIMEEEEEEEDKNSQVDHASQAALNEFSTASPPPADRTTAEELSGRQEEVKRSLMAVQNQTSLNRTVVDQQQAELRDNVETSQQLVHGFLQEELQQDVPTGATPQRRDFVYPKRLEKLRSRGELLESLRRQQEELQAAIVEEEEEEEDKNSQVDHDSLEDELSTCNESLATELSFVDENLVFNESKRVPFFKQKKGSKKETKILARQKAPENEPSTPQKSRLPLRSQN